MRPLQVLVVSDGVPGHDRASFGIVSALGRHHEIVATSIPIAEKVRGSRRVKRTLARVLPFSTYWARFYGIGERTTPANPIPQARALPDGPIDIVISTGPATAAANIALARRFRAKNIYFGFPQWPVTGAFSVLVSSAATVSRRNIVAALRPSELDASRLPRPIPLHESNSGRGVMLIGGDTKHYRYSKHDFELLADRLNTIARELPDLTWTVFDSRRTPSLPFEHFCRRIDAGPASIGIVRYDRSGLLSNKQAFEADIVLVTADSMSMISEAVAAGRPTIVVEPDRYRPPRRDAREHAVLLAQRRIHRLRFSELDAERLVRGTAALDLIPQSEPERLYAAIAARANL